MRKMRVGAVKVRITATVLMVSLALVAFASGADELDSLRNDLDNIIPQPDEPLHIATTGGFDVFRPEFIAIACKDRPTTWRQTAGRAPSLTAVKHSNSASRSAHQPMRSIEDHHSAKKSYQGRNRYREGRKNETFLSSEF